ncbi:MAG TPA: GTP 3',8-cyclase MoaA [Candidatus Omnitrophica bacterium]|nr:GTP 3',8-cyclase MoaA [Candidatus Omnitrophota bacterium]
MGYLRLSITDRCNLRCGYCIPKEGIVTQPHEAILSFEEILRFLKIFADLGIKKIRLTGGEPLVRKGIVDLVKNISQIDGLEEICLTTNGILLSSYVKDLKNAGLKSMNISLDTLRQERFKSITGKDLLGQVLDGINRARKLFNTVKLNVVVRKQVNDDEIVDFVNFAQENNLILRFIEFMKVTPLWEESFFVPIEKVRNICHSKFGLEWIGYRNLGPAEYYRYSDGIIGFIKTHSLNCRMCSRLRLTAIGELKLCLYQPKGVSLRDFLRSGVEDSFIKAKIKNLMSTKDAIDYTSWEESGVYMSSVGG